MGANINLFLKRYWTFVRSLPINIMKPKILAVAFLLLPFVSFAFAQEIYQDGWIDRNKNGVKDPYENPELSIEKRVEDLIGRMTIEEKTCQTGTIYGYKRVTSAQGFVRVQEDGTLRAESDCAIKIEKESVEQINKLMRDHLPGMLNVDANQLGLSRDIDITVNMTYRPRT